MGTSNGIPIRVTVQSRPLGVALIAAIGGCVAWGALAFGAVYTWTFVPLAVACAATGALALAALGPRRPPLRGLGLAFAVVAAAVAVQVAPLPGALIDRISPHADAFAGQSTPALVDVAGPARQDLGRQLSIASSRTGTGLGLFAAFALFALGVARVASATGARPLGTTIVVFGMFLAVVGIGQYTLTSKDIHPLIYGFWKPEEGTRPFGPFVNPNHFAGWMLMTTSVALGFFLDAFQMCLAFLADRPRDRRSLLGTPQFGASVLFGGAYLIMTLSLLMTRSRSAVVAFSIAGALAALMVFRRQASRPARLAVAAGFVMLIFGSIAWAGLDTMASKFQEDRGRASAGGRISAWRDTLRIVRDFPLAGTGLNTYGVAMELYQSERAIQFHEAHNDYLQLAAEGGVLVGVPILITLAVFVRSIGQRFREAPRRGSTYWIRVGTVIGLIAIAVQSLMEFSLQMPGNAALFAVLVGIAIHQSPNLRTAQVPASGSA